MRIYKTTNKVNGKIYIGQTSKNENSEYLGSGLIIKRAIKKYGENNFTITVIERCSCQKQLNKREIFWISFYDSTNKKIGYNVSKGGNGGNLGEIVNKKISTRLRAIGQLKGKVSVKDKNGNFFSVNKEDKRYISGELVGVQKGIAPHNKGIPMSKVQKKKLSKIMTGRRAKRIICTTTGIKYKSITEAAKALGLHKPNIIEVLKNRVRKTGGLVFEYL